VAAAIAPPSASISLTKWPLPMPPIDGLQDIWPSVSMLCVSSSVRLPMRAAASAASVPAWPPPTTITSNCCGKSTLAMVCGSRRKGGPRRGDGPRGAGCQKGHRARPGLARPRGSADYRPCGQGTEVPPDATDRHRGPDGSERGGLFHVKHPAEHLAEGGQDAADCCFTWNTAPCSH